LDETRERESVLERERAALADSLATARREFEESQAAVDRGAAMSADVAARAEAARNGEKAARDADAVARAALFNTDEALSALEGKVNGLEGLERERVGMAPAAARLLNDRAQFGEGA